MEKVIPSAVFVRDYLPISATFIYRQMKGVEPEFKPSVICRRTNNLDVFPHERIFQVPDHRRYNDTLLEKITGKLRRTITGYYNYPGKASYLYWAGKLKTKGCRLIHAHFGIEGIIMLPLAKRLGIPLIVTLHGFDMSKLLKKRGYEKKLRDMFEKCDLIIAVSDKFKEDAILKGCNPDKIVRHYIGVPVEEFSFHERERKENSPVNFLQVSNFVEKKGHTFSIKAYANLLKEGVQAKLTFVGDGQTRKECENLANKMGISDKVVFTGKKPMGEIPGYMKKADIFVHHSVTSSDGDMEGIPTVIMEAMAVGLPIITTRHSGIPELVVDGKSGFMVEERDVVSYTKRMIEIAGNYETRISMGRFNRDRIIEDFNMTKQNQELKSLYYRVLDRWSRHGKPRGMIYHSSLLF